VVNAASVVEEAHATVAVVSAMAAPKHATCPTRVAWRRRKPMKRLLLLQILKMRVKQPVKHAKVVADVAVADGVADVVMIVRHARTNPCQAMPVENHRHNSALLNPPKAPLMHRPRLNRMHQEKSAHATATAVNAARVESEVNARPALTRLAVQSKDPLQNLLL